MVRHPVLRTGKPIETCNFTGDELETTVHLGLFIDNNIVAICSFFENSNANIAETLQYQLRGMAVLKSFQGQGLGSIILKHGEQLLHGKGVNLIWCNAREIAVNFYKNLGYKVTGAPFNITDIGLHYAMYKPL